MPPSGTIKYRAACDHCSTTKIKCSQERPQCARCRALGRDCHYSRSLRAGLNRKLSNAPVLPRHNSIPENGPFIQTNCAPYPNNYYTPISPGTKQDPTWIAHSTPYPTSPGHGPHGNPEIPYFPDFTTSDSNLSSASSLDPDWLFDFNKSAHLLSETRASSMDSTMTGTSHHSSPDSDGHRTPPDFMDLGSLHGMTDMTLPTPLSSPASCGHSCAKGATEMLKQLYDIPTISTDANTTQTTVDQVLSTTSRAVQTCHALITCHCAKDFHLPVLIATIFSKVLAWYQAVAWIQDPQTKGTELDFFAKEVVLDDNLALGSYRLDDHMGWTLKNHIVYGHLQRLGDAISLWHDTFTVGNQGDSRHINGTMGVFLKTRLQFTMRELDRRLSVGSS
ncbi:hypothetical protein AC579_9303 [Pseudocercospora musae]|uniref:Zn(2)-C6 fungal-type domain-containing protein n=1 Tax=Pseudocercospora musae TaxID=113226 RepID=A0A139I4Y9_9PEZI|nr:hypothetical protein AC579_9303 [Pseudocercospora musae]